MRSYGTYPLYLQVYNHHERKYQYMKVMIKSSRGWSISRQLWLNNTSHDASIVETESANPLTVNLSSIGMSIGDTATISIAWWSPPYTINSSNDKVTFGQSSRNNNVSIASADEASSTIQSTSPGMDQPRVPETLADQEQWSTDTIAKDGEPGEQTNNFDGQEHESDAISIASNAHKIMIRGLQAGESTVTITDAKGKKREVDITINPRTITIKQWQRIAYSAADRYTIKQIYYKSSVLDVRRIRDGEHYSVYAKKPGTTTMEVSLYNKHTHKYYRMTFDIMVEKVAIYQQDQQETVASQDLSVNHKTIITNVGQTFDLDISGGGWLYSVTVDQNAIIPLTQETLQINTDVSIASSSNTVSYDIGSSCVGPCAVDRSQLFQAIATREGTSTMTIRDKHSHQEQQVTIDVRQAQYTIAAWSTRDYNYDKRLQVTANSSDSSIVSIDTSTAGKLVFQWKQSGLANITLTITNPLTSKQTEAILWVEVKQWATQEQRAKKWEKQQGRRQASIWHDKTTKDQSLTQFDTNVKQQLASLWVEQVTRKNSISKEWFVFCIKGKTTSCQTITPSWVSVANDGQISFTINGKDRWHYGQSTAAGLDFENLQCVEWIPICEQSYFDELAKYTFEPEQTVQENALVVRDLWEDIEAEQARKMIRRRESLVESEEWNAIVENRDWNDLADEIKANGLEITDTTIGMIKSAADDPVEFAFEMTMVADIRDTIVYIEEFDTMTEDERLVWWIALSMALVPWVSKKEAKKEVARFVEEVGKYTWKLWNYNKMSKDQLEKSITTLGKRINEHQEKILKLKNGTYEIDTQKVNWDLNKYKNGLLRHWEKEVKTLSNNREKAKAALENLLN